MSHIEELAGPHNAPGPPIADVRARERRARAVPRAGSLALLQAHGLVHVRGRAVGQFHPRHLEEPVGRAVEPRLPDAAVRAVSEAPGLGILRRESECAVAHRRGIGVADPIRTALLVIVALILGSVPIRTYALVGK